MDYGRISQGSSGKKLSAVSGQSTSPQSPAPFFICGTACAELKSFAEQLKLFAISCNYTPQQTKSSPQKNRPHRANPFVAYLNSSPY